MNQRFETDQTNQPSGLITPEADSHAPVLTTEEARQGETSGRVRLVLFSSLALAAVAFVVLYAQYTT